MKIAFVSRATRYSPNSAARDAAILDAVRQRLSVGWGVECGAVVGEDALTEAADDLADAQCFVSMARSQDALNWLGDHERQWTPVINPTAAVMLCNQRPLAMRIASEYISVPPAEGPDGYWVKRGYGCTQSADDVQFAASREEADRLCAAMQQRGIPDVLVQAHVAGPLVKCYGVHGTGFFYANHPLDTDSLHRALDAVAAACCLDVYGADCILRPDGQPVLIDLNDWPSFSCCRDEAADAIAQRIMQRIRDEV